VAADRDKPGKKCSVSVKSAPGPTAAGAKRLLIMGVVPVGSRVPMIKRVGRR